MRRAPLPRGRSYQTRIALQTDRGRLWLSLPVRRRAGQLIRDATVAAAEAVTTAYLIVVVPLLYESPLKAFVDRILVVDQNTGQREEVEALRAHHPR